MPPSCVNCNRPFPPNNELASLATGTSIAFDPTRNRVWRICDSCSEWTLVGPETSAIALPEIEARHRVISPSADDQLVPIRVSNTLELIRVGDPDAVNDAYSLAQIRAETDDRNRGARMMRIGGSVIYLAWAAYTIATGGASSLAGVVAMVATSFFLLQLGNRIWGAKVGRHSLLHSGLFAVGTMLVAALVVPVESLGYMATGIAVVSPMPLILLPAFHKLTDRARITGPDNRDIKLTPKQRAAVSFSWETDSDQLSVFGVTGHSVFTGSHAELGCLELAQHALNDNAKGSPIAQLGTQARSHEQAFNLLRAIGGLRGLLRALDSYRNDVNGRVFFQDLPPIYLTAFVLALGARTRDGTAHEALRERANASGLLAEEAEGI